MLVHCWQVQSSAWGPAGWLRPMLCALLCRPPPPQQQRHLLTATALLNPCNLCTQGQEVGRQCFCLMSPTQRPPELGEASKTGNLLTLFLTGPLMGVCLLAGNTDPSTQQLVDTQAALNSLMGEWAASLLRAFSGGSASKSPWQVVFRDALLRRLILRFVLCRACISLHTSVGTSLAHLPKVFPELPREVSADFPDIVAGVHRLAACLGRQHMFGDKALSISSGSPMSVATNQ